MHLDVLIATKPAMLALLGVVWAANLETWLAGLAAVAMATALIAALPVCRSVIGDGRGRNSSFGFVAFFSAGLSGPFAILIWLAHRQSEVPSSEAVYVNAVSLIVLLPAFVLMLAALRTWRRLAFL